MLEPVIGKINERAEAPRTFGSRLGLRSQRSEWFRVYRVSFKVRFRSLCSNRFPIGLLPSVRVIRLDLLEGQDCHSLHEGL